MLDFRKREGFIERLYGRDNVESEIRRFELLQEKFTARFGAAPEALFSAPGRTEICGNHTDHQRGCVLAASVNLDTVGMVRETGDGWIRMYSEGIGAVEVELCDLKKKKEEGTTASLIRGVAFAFAKRGCDFTGRGLEIYVSTMVPVGSGLSSSAAFEVLIGVIINSLYFDSSMTAIEIAQAGQFAENEYFGKPSGLMDQMASSVGGAVFIDFKDIVSPAVIQMPFPLDKLGYALCIIDSHAGHEDLTAEYAAIPAECRAVAAYFGKDVLREVDEEDFYANLSDIREKLGDRPALRALHFFQENARVQYLAEYISRGDIPNFLRMIRVSGRSSAMYLQNIIPNASRQHQEMMMALALAHSSMKDGAERVHGGGFGGTIQAFVNMFELDSFRKKMDSYLGQGSCHVLRIRQVGACRVI